MDWSNAASSAPRRLWSCLRPVLFVLILKLLVESLRVLKWLKNRLFSRFYYGSDRLDLRLVLFDHIQNALFNICTKLWYFLKLGFMTGHLRNELIVIFLTNFKHSSTGCCKACILSFLEFCKLLCTLFRLGITTTEWWNCHSSSVSYYSFDFAGLFSCWALARSLLRLGSIRDTFLLNWTIVVKV